MDELREAIRRLPVIETGGATCLPYRAAVDQAAAFLFPNRSLDELDRDRYRQAVAAAGNLCRELGYGRVARRLPPEVSLNKTGLYWVKEPPSETDILRRAEAPRLLDALLDRVGLDDISRQHFKIPVTASAGVVDLLQQAIGSGWPNDYWALWHDICSMCIAGGWDVGDAERRFVVIIHGLAQRTTWQMQATLRRDPDDRLYLYIALAEEADKELLFEPGRVVMTAGAAGLTVDFTPCLARHLTGDWGDLDPFDVRQNRRAIVDESRILSAYNVPVPGGGRRRIWIITEADRSVTTVLLPEEY